MAAAGPRATGAAGGWSLWVLQATYIPKNNSLPALSAQPLQLEQQLREASGRAETEASQRSQAERQLGDTQAQLRAAQAKAAEAEALPGLRRELAEQSAAAEALRARQAELEGEGEGLRRQLAAARDAAAAAQGEAQQAQRLLDDLAASHATIQQQLRGEVQDLQVGCGAVSGPARPGWATGAGSPLAQGVMLC